MKNNINREQKLIKNTVIIAFGMFCTKGISFLLLPLYTSILSTEGYGAVDLVTTLVTLLAYTFTMQFEQGVFRFLIDCRDKEKEKKQIVSTTIVSVLFSLFAGTVMTWLICHAFGFEYTIFLILNIVTTLLASVFGQILRGFGEIGLYTISSFLSASGQMILNVIFIVFLDMREYGLLLSSILGPFFSALFSFSQGKIYTYIDLRSFCIESFQSLAKYSFPLVPNTLCWWLVNMSDRIFIVTFLGTSYNGIYALANKFSSLFYNLTNVFQISWTENASENSKEKDRDEYYSKIMNKSVLIMICCCSGIISLVPLFIAFIDNKFSNAYFHVMILLIGSFFHSWGNLYASLFSAIRNTSYITKTTIFAALINVLINAAAIKTFKLYSASISTVISYIVILVMSHREISKDLSIVYDKKKLLSSFLILFISVVSFCINNHILSVIATLLIVCFSYLINRDTIDILINSIMKKMAQDQIQNNLK